MTKAMTKLKCLEKNNQEEKDGDELRVITLLTFKMQKMKKTLMKPCMPGRNISILLNLIYFENLFRDIGFSSFYCFVPVYLSKNTAPVIRPLGQMKKRLEASRALTFCCDSKQSNVANMSRQRIHLI